MLFAIIFFFFFFNDTATTEIYTLSLHDALPIWPSYGGREGASHMYAAYIWFLFMEQEVGAEAIADIWNGFEDRKSTRLNSSHANISYAVFCLKKKKK